MSKTIQKRISRIENINLKIATIKDNKNNDYNFIIKRIILIFVM